jgi:hypothetical protein
MRERAGYLGATAGPRGTVPAPGPRRTTEPLTDMPASLRVHLRSLLRSAAVVLLPVAIAACDPCSGTSACVEYEFRAEGQMLWWSDGKPASAVRVEFYPDAESGLDAQVPIIAHTDRTGTFRWRFSAPGREEVTGIMLVYPPPPHEEGTYGVGDIRIRKSRVRGDAQYLGWWGVGPIPDQK